MEGGRRGGVRLEGGWRFDSGCEDDQRNESNTTRIKVME